MGGTGASSIEIKVTATQTVTRWMVKIANQAGITELEFLVKISRINAVIIEVITNQVIIEVITREKMTNCIITITVIIIVLKLRTHQQVKIVEQRTAQ